ncbi:MAG: SDR family oxidoreductase [Chloroflexota bacterium]|nr:SDR family oxidoreductase [Chloroflexota bacterium]
MDLGLKGKSVIVTGGGSNIGRAIVLAFAQEGATITIAEIDEEQGKKVAAEANALGGKTSVIKTDITQYESVEAMVNKVIKDNGCVDILVNNVGWDQLQLFIDTTPEFWDKIININYKGMLNCTKAVLGHMVERKAGSIVSIGSDAGRMGEYREAVYGGCKGAQIAFSKAVARETGRYGVRLNVVCPGMTLPSSADEIGDQSMHKLGLAFFTDEMKEKASKSYALRRLGEPEDVARVAVFIASDAASFVTGQTLSVSGGYTMM